MKWIILLLLLINGGYFTWQYFYESSPDSNVSGDSKNKSMEYDTLVLLSDLSEERKELLGIVDSESESSSEQTTGKPLTEASKEKAVDTAGQEQSTSDIAEVTIPEKDEIQSAIAENTKDDKETVDTKIIAAKYCYVIGPIKKKASIERVSRHIRSMGLDIIKIRKTIDKVPSHWIYLSGYKSENDANRDIRKLASNGVKDTQIIKRSATNVIISVGLFSTKSGADERLKKLQESGFAPQTSMVTANKSLYWIDLKYKDGELVNKAILESIVKGVSGVKVNEAECDK